MGGAEQRSVLYNIPIMLRNILIVTGLLVAIDPFLGFPQSVDKFILIDYVNDQCDMRLRSNHVDGIPDEVVSEFVQAMKEKIISF